MATTTTPLTLPQQPASVTPTISRPAQRLASQMVGQLRWLLLRLSLALHTFTAWYWPERATWWDTWRCARERDLSLRHAERVSEATVRAWVLRKWRGIARSGRDWPADADLWRVQMRELLATLGAVVEAHEDADGAQHFSTRLGYFHAVCDADTQPTLEALSLLAELDAPLARTPRSADPTTRPAQALPQTPQTNEQTEGQRGV